MPKRSTDFMDYLLPDKEASLPVGGGEDYANRYLTAGYDPADAVEQRMQGRELGKGQFSSVQGLTDRGRQAHSLDLPVEAGTKVQLMANSGAVLAYDDLPPALDEVGTVVSVKSATLGTITAHEGRVFVEWSDGKVRPIFAEHLRVAKGSPRYSHALPNRFRIASLGDLSSFFDGTQASSSKSGELVHRATKDLWAFKQVGGEYIIERLFDDTGDPLKG